MSSTHLPDDIDRDKLAEAALAILSLTLHDGGRVWKGLDWDLMDLLHEKGWIVDPRSKAKSVVLTEDGERLAREFLRKHFGSRGWDEGRLRAAGPVAHDREAGCARRRTPTSRSGRARSRRLDVGVWLVHARSGYAAMNFSSENTVSRDSM